jgi:hypothetical protein
MVQHWYPDQKVRHGTVAPALAIDVDQVLARDIHQIVLAVVAIATVVGV